VSAVASQPLVTIRTVAVRVAVAPVTVLVVVSAVVRTLVAWSRATPAYFPDEYMYSEFGRSIARGELPAVRGVSAHFLPIVMPLITAPGWLLPNVEDGYRAVQAIEATFMSLAAIPVYLLARRLGLSTRMSLLGAVLSLTIPSMMLSSFVVSEPIAYPIVLAAVFAAVHALDRPSWRSYSLFLAFAALAALTRMQFAVLLPCFLLAVILLAVRERRLFAFIKQSRVPLALFVVVAGALLALGPARNTGYYPSLFYIPGFHLGTATRYFGADLLVLTFASGFVLVPGAILGIWLAVTKPRARTESAFAILAVLFTLALLLESVVYGDLGFVQERYLFYVLPLWTLAFLLYAQRKWPLKIAHGVLAVLILAASLAMPLSKYAAGGGQAHSAFLFALSWLVGPTGSLGAASVLIAYAGGAAVVLLVGLAFRWPRLVTPYAIAFALVATTAASVGATRYDQTNASNIRSVVVGNDASWVDEAHVGKTTLLLAPGGKIPDAKLFWNKSLDRLLLIPGVKPPDSFASSTVDVGNNGVVKVAGKPVTGPVMIDDWGTAMELQNATLVKRTIAGALYKTHGSLRLRLLAFGLYADGWLGSRGAIIVWPSAGEHGLQGTLQIPVQSPGRSGFATIKLTLSGSEKHYTFRTVHGRKTTLSIPVCTFNAASFAFTAGPMGGLGDGRGVAARVGKIRYVPNPAVCKTTSHRSNG
jgi:hypothetical protein